MSTIKSSAENLTLNADGANNDIKFQSNGSEVASIDQAGVMTATTFSGSGASLTALPAAQLTGALPAISGASLTNLPSADISVDSWHLSLNSTTDVSSTADIDFSTTQHLGSNLSESGGVITVGTAGMYLVTYSAVMPGSPARTFDLNLYVNGSLVNSTYLYAYSADGYQGREVTVNLQLAATDIIKVRGSGHFYGNPQSMCRFTGTRIGA
tara:strand:+ start:402 stop:1034 length:633 start_codon:yes stop_codon:yes gene_type:complete